jgi:magnesium-transporting ATPase (P-type)
MTSFKLQQLSEQQWHQLSTDDITEYFKTDLLTGLSIIEVSQLQERYGFNELQGKAGNSPFVRFLMEFNQPLIYILSHCWNRHSTTPRLGGCRGNSGRNVDELSDWLYPRIKS